MLNLDLLMALDPSVAQTMRVVGAALTHEQQMHVSAHLRALPAFLATEEGKIALQTFVGDWQASMKKAEQPAP